MNIPDKVMRLGWREYTGGVNPAELPRSWHAFCAGAEWGRREALEESSEIAAAIGALADGTAGDS